MTAEDKGASAARALFVLGAPRSGTTLVGNYLGSADGVLNLGEYGGFHLAYNIAPSTLGAMPGSYREPYLRDLVVHAQWFAEGLAASEHKSWYCDTTPFNIRAADRMAAEMPDALFILMLRHYSGTIQSLRRSFASGFHWAGQSWVDSANVWANAYQSVASLPVARTLVVSFDALCASPEPVIEKMVAWVREHGYPVDGLDLEEFAVSHAPPSSGPRPTIGHLVEGQVELRAMSSFEQIRWSGDIQRAVWPVVEPVHRALQSRYPRIYGAPDPPAELWTHDDIQGLLPLVIGDNW